MATKVISDNKRIAKNTMLLYVRSLLLVIISLYTSRVVLQSLGVQDFGIYNVVGGLVAMFSMLNSSMSSASQRFITFALGGGDMVHLKKVLSTSITLHIILGIIIVLLLEILGVWFLYNKLNIPSDRLDIAFWVMQFSIATLFANIVSVPFNASIIAHERMSAFAYITILEGILKLILAVSLLYATTDRLLLYAAFMFGIALILVLIYSAYSLRNFEETRGVKIKIEKELFNEMFSFAGWNLFGNGSLVLRNQGIDILLNLFFGVTINAAKGVCNQVQGVIYQFVANFQTAVNPQLTKSVAIRNYDRTRELLFQGSRFSFFLLCFFAVPLILVAPQLLSLWLVEVPYFTVEFIRWTMIYLLWDTLSRLLINSVLASGQIKTYQMSVGITKLLALPLAYIWLKLGGSPLVGIWVNIILDLVCLAIRLRYNNNYYDLNIRNFLVSVVLRCWGVFILSLFSSYLLCSIMIDNFIVKVLIALGCTIIAIGVMGVNNSERSLALTKIRHIIRKTS